MHHQKLLTWKIQKKHILRKVELYVCFQTILMKMLCCMAKYNFPMFSMKRKEFEMDKNLRNLKVSMRFLNFLPF